MTVPMQSSIVSTLDHLASWRGDLERRALHFYSRRIVQIKNSVEEVKTGDWLLLNEAGLGELQDEGLNVKIIETGNSFSVTNLTPAFLNYKTRPDVVGQYFLVQILEPLEE